MVTPACISKTIMFIPACISKTVMFIPACISKTVMFTPACISKIVMLIAACISKTVMLMPACISKNSFVYTNMYIKTSYVYTSIYIKNSYVYTRMHIKKSCAAMCVLHFLLNTLAAGLAAFKENCLLAGCLTSKKNASVSQGRTCSDKCTFRHTEIEVADQTVHLTQSQYTDTGPTSPSTDPITPGAWQGSHWSASFKSRTGMT